MEFSFWMVFLPQIITQYSCLMSVRSFVIDLSVFKFVNPPAFTIGNLDLFKKVLISTMKSKLKTFEHLIF
jgi:hypothetical protein